MIIGRILEARGIKTTWLAKELDISQSHLSRLLSKERPWTPELRKEAARILMLPEDVIFLSGNGQLTEQIDRR